jgi:hypothetical protein
MLVLPHIWCCKPRLLAGEALEVLRSPEGALHVLGWNKLIFCFWVFRCASVPCPGGRPQVVHQKALVHSRHAAHIEGENNSVNLWAQVSQARK